MMLRGLFDKAFKVWVLLTLAQRWIDRLPETGEAVLGILEILFWPLQDAYVRIPECREIIIQRIFFRNVRESIGARR